MVRQNTQLTLNPRTNDSINLFGENLPLRSNDLKQKRHAYPLTRVWG